MEFIHSSNLNFPKGLAHEKAEINLTIGYTFWAASKGMFIISVEQAHHLPAW
jgi:hypothetical protein